MGNLGACERAQTKSRRAGNFVWMKAWTGLFLDDNYKVRLYIHANMVVVLHL